jgi:haloalkane dehalogenase
MTGRGPFSADYPFAPNYVEVNGARMHYADVGEGRPFLFLHGNSTWSYMWRNVIPHLQDKGRCIAPDLIGFGKSDKPDIDYNYAEHYTYILAFIEALDLQDITLVLHDWGGGLGLNYAMNRPENIRGIAFMETFVRTFDSWDDWPQDLVEGFKQFRTPGLSWELIVEKNVFMLEILPYGIHRTLSEEEMAAYLEPFKEVAHRTPLWMWPQELPIAGQPDGTSRIIRRYVSALKKSELPKLLFHVQPGAIIPPETVEMCKRDFPNLEDVFLGESRHYVAEDFPHEIGEKIAQWSESIG